MDYTATFEAYMMFRISETEHIEKAYNKKDGTNPLMNAESNGLTGSGETDGPGES